MYTIVGGNQQPYGPVDADQIRAWVVEGRANGNTIARFNDGAWKPLRTFSEFADLFGAPPAADTPSATPPPISANTPPPFQANPGYGASSFGPATGQTHTLSVVGLVCSCLGLLPCCCFPLSLVGLICSVIAYNQLSGASDGVYTTSKSIPLIGIWVGIAGLLLGGVLLAVRGMSGAFRHLM